MHCIALLESQLFPAAKSFVRDPSICPMRASVFWPWISLFSPQWYYLVSSLLLLAVIRTPICSAWRMQACRAGVRYGSLACVLSDTRAAGGGQGEKGTAALWPFPALTAAMASSLQGPFDLGRLDPSAEECFFVPAGSAALFLPALCWFFPLSLYIFAGDGSSSRLPSSRPCHEPWHHQSSGDAAACNNSLRILQLAHATLV